MKDLSKTDTYELIRHGWYWDARVTRSTGESYSMTYNIGPFLTRWGAKREAKKALKNYVVRHKIKKVK